MFKDMTNEEMSAIIKAFYKCDNCITCPCDMVLCFPGNSEARRKEFALEVAKRLVEGIVTKKKKKKI